MKQDKQFNKIYFFDQSTNRYMIEIALDQYTDIFNEWDPAPFKRREIDPDLERYLLECSQEIPLRYPVELCFTVPSTIRNVPMEKEITDALSNCFSFKIYFKKKDLKKIKIQILDYLLIGFVFLWIGTVFPGKESELIWITILVEGIFIGGWVLIWQAVSLFFFTNREQYYRYLIYKRLLNSPIIFREAFSSN